MLRPAAKAATTTTKIARPMSGDRVERHVGVAGQRQEPEGDGREREHRELVPDAGERDREPDAVPAKPQPRSIANDSAIPTAAPPGATYVEAVEACVTTNA